MRKVITASVLIAASMIATASASALGYGTLGDTLVDGGTAAPKRPNLQLEDAGSALPMRGELQLNGNAQFLSA